MQSAASFRRVRFTKCWKATYGSIVCRADWNYAESGSGIIDTGASLATFQGLQASPNIDLRCQSHSIPRWRVSVGFWSALISCNVVVCLEDEFARRTRVAVCIAQDHIWTMIRLSVSVSGYRLRY
jgi:hypothetical protein